MANLYPVKNNSILRRDSIKNLVWKLDTKLCFHCHVDFVLRN
jgi:hypothetical protein